MELNVKMLATYAIFELFRINLFKILKKKCFLQFNKTSVKGT